MIGGVVNVRFGHRYDVYIGRAVPRYDLPESRWANPFPITDERDRSAVLERFEQWLFEPAQLPLLQHVREQLRYKVLGCWCTPQQCHGDLYVELAHADEALVCGGRNFLDEETIRARLQHLPPKTVVIHGDQRGADTVAGRVAKSLGLRVIPFPAWGPGSDPALASAGKGAGHLRNIRMLLRRPKYVLAFHDDLSASRGTKHCVDAARLAGHAVERFRTGDREPTYIVPDSEWRKSHA